MTQVSSLPPIQNPYFQPLPRAHRPSPNAKSKSHNTPCAAASDSITELSVSDIRSSQSLDFDFTDRVLQREDLASIYTLYHPAPEYFGKFKLSVNNIDLKWLLKKPVKTPKEWLTLESMDFKTNTVTSNNVDPSEILLNSPRSVLTLYHQGITVHDIIYRPLEYFRKIMDLEGRSKRVIEMRYNHHEEKRQSLVTRLQEAYRKNCNEMTRSEILSFFSSYQHSVPSNISDHSGNMTWIDKVSVSPTKSAQSLNDLFTSVQSTVMLLSPTHKSAEDSAHDWHEGPNSPKDIEMPTVTTLEKIDYVPTPIPQSDPLAINVVYPTPPTSAFKEKPRPSQLVNPTLLLPSLTSSAGNIPSPVSSQTSIGQATQKSQQSLASQTTSKWSQRIEDSRARMDKLVDTDLCTRARALEMQRQQMLVSTQREIDFEKRRQAVLLQKEIQQRTKAEELKSNQERHRQMAEAQFQLQRKKIEEQNNKRIAAEQARQQLVELVRDNKRSAAAKNKTKRLERLLILHQRRFEAEDESLLEFEAKQKQIQEKIEAYEAEKHARLLELKQRNEELGKRRFEVKERSELILNLQRQDAEIRAENTRQRLEHFFAKKENEDEERKAEFLMGEAKRKRVIDTAKALEESRRSKMVSDQQRFDDHWKQIQEQRKIENEEKEEHQRLKIYDKLKVQEHRRNVFEFSKLRIVDELQRRDERAQLEAQCKDVALTNIKQEYETGKRQRDRLVQIMQEQQVRSDKAATALVYQKTSSMPQLLN